VSSSPISDNSSTAPCPGSSGLSTAKQCLYAIGGWTIISDVEYEDPSAATRSWTTMTNNLNTARQYLGTTPAPCPAPPGWRRGSYASTPWAGSTGPTIPWPVSSLKIPA
jgi:hypothetical protein